MKAFAALVGLVAGSALLNLMTSDLTQTLMGAAGGLVVGFMAPDFYLGNKAGGRAKNIADVHLRARGCEAPPLSAAVRKSSRQANSSSPRKWETQEPMD